MYSDFTNLPLNLIYISPTSAVFFDVLRSHLCIINRAHSKNSSSQLAMGSHICVTSFSRNGNRFGYNDNVAAISTDVAAFAISSRVTFVRGKY